MTFPKELYRHHHYRVVHSIEEHGKFLADGWAEHREPGVEYCPHTAVPIVPAPIAAPVPIAPPLRIPEPSEIEDDKSGRRCGKCGESGHNARTCDKG